MANKLRPTLGVAYAQATLEMSCAVMVDKGTAKGVKRKGNGIEIRAYHSKAKCKNKFLKKMIFLGGWNNEREKVFI